MFEPTDITDKEDARWFYVGIFGMCTLFILFLGWLAYLSN